jgi:hypothetical protein
VRCEVSGVSTPIRRTSVRPSTAGVTSTPVTVYHPADGDHETAVLQVARFGQRGIILQRGSERTAGHEHEERRQKEKTDRSRPKTLWSSRRHGYRMIALFPSRGSTSGLEE